MKEVIFYATRDYDRPFERRYMSGGYLPIGIDIKDWKNVENKQLG